MYIPTPRFLQYMHRPPRSVDANSRARGKNKRGVLGPKNTSEVNVFGRDAKPYVRYVKRGGYKHQILPSGQYHGDQLVSVMCCCESSPYDGPNLARALDVEKPKCLLDFFLGVQLRVPGFHWNNRETARGAGRKARTRKRYAFIIDRRKRLWAPYTIRACVPEEDAR